MEFPQIGQRYLFQVRDPLFLGILSPHFYATVDKIDGELIYLSSISMYYDNGVIKDTNNRKIDSLNFQINNIENFWVAHPPPPRPSAHPGFDGGRKKRSLKTRNSKRRMRKSKRLRRR
jgi:hypothetical protein